jgi:hypothetical protein
VLDEGFDVSQTDVRTNKGVKDCCGIRCNETLKRTLNSNCPVVTPFRAHGVDVHHASFAVLFYVTIARLNVLCEQEPQGPKLTEFEKRKHLLPPYAHAGYPAMLCLGVYQ